MFLLFISKNKTTNLNNNFSFKALFFPKAFSKYYQDIVIIEHLFKIYFCDVWTPLILDSMWTFFLCTHGSLHSKYGKGHTLYNIFLVS
jgi:hypothetical protein